MSEDSNFLSRWSRLKRQNAQERAKPPVDAPRAEEAVAGRPAAAGPESGPATEPEIDLSTLPSLEEITASTDIRAFLQAGVPAELAKAALRRAWSADPAIRDFVGIAENQWDFTNPASIPGFGPLQPGDNVPELVARAMGTLDKTLDATEPTDTALAKDTRPGDPVEPAAGDREEPPQSVDVAPRSDERISESPGVIRQDAEGASHAQQVATQDEEAVTSNRRGHGRALPQ